MHQIKCVVSKLSIEWKWAPNQSNKINQNSVRWRQNQSSIAKSSIKRPKIYIEQWIYINKIKTNRKVWRSYLSRYTDFQRNNWTKPKF